MAARSEEARPVVVAWPDVERVVAAVVERKQRLRELEARREGLRSSLAKAIEERSEQATKWELQEEKQVKWQHLIFAVRRQKEELESLKQHSADLRTGLKARQSRLNKAKVQLKEAGHRLQEADQILEAHGKRLGEKLKSEVRGLQLLAIADLTVVFPISELVPRAGMRSLEALHKAGLESHEATIGARAGSCIEPRGLGSDTAGRNRPKAVQKTAECESAAAGREAVSLEADSGSGEDAKRHVMSRERSSAHRRDESSLSCHPNGRSSAREGHAEGAEKAALLKHLGEAVGNSCVEDVDVHSRGSRDEEDRCEACTSVRVPSHCEGIWNQDEVNRAGHLKQQAETDGSSRVAGVVDSMERCKGEGHTQSRKTQQLLASGGENSVDETESSANTVRNGSRGEKSIAVQDKVPAVEKGLNAEGTFLICGIPLLSAHRLRHAGLLDESQRQQQAAALGMCAQVVHLVAFYSSLTLRYPVQWKGSSSTILDPCPPVSAQQATTNPLSQDITLPLFPESMKNFSRCTFAMVLLAKDVEQILSFFGLQWYGDRHAILENLSYLMKGEVPSRSIFSSKSSHNMTGSIKRHISCPSFKDSL